MVITSYHNKVFIFALREESQNLFDNQDVVYTGIGKVNAAYTLTKHLSINKPDLVINLGTAGSPVFKTGEIVNCTKFVQRDMDVTPLGFDQWQTPFSDDPVPLIYGERIEAYPEAICGSGDNFETAHRDEAYQVVDMEAYVLALICQRFSVPFLCLKYISDGADESASQDWQETLKDAAQALYKAVSN